MRRSNWAVAVLLTAGLIGTASFRASAADEKAAGDKAASSSTEKPAKKSAKAAKLVKPWSDMTSLSEDQKAKIVDIHKKSNEEKKAIDQKEHDAIMALLNDDQKAEAEKLAAAKKGSMKKDAAGGQKGTDGAAEKK